MTFVKRVRELAKVEGRHHLWRLEINIDQRQYALLQGRKRFAPFLTLRLHHLVFRHANLACNPLMLRQPIWGVAAICNPQRRNLTQLRRQRAFHHDRSAKPCEPTLHVESGASVAVIGLGAVGLSTVMGAKIAGAGPIAAFDRIQSRVAMAEEFGASCAIEITGELSETAEAANLADFDYIIDTTGVTEVLQQAVGLLAPKGALALVAAYAPEPKLWIDPSYIMSGGRRVIGVVEGDSDPQTFIPKLIEHHREGRLPFDRMIQYYPFDRILDAISDGETGKTIKPVIRMQ